MLSFLNDFWTYPLVMIDKNPITVAKVITGLVLLVVGYFICKNLSKEFSKRVLTKLDIDDSLRATLQTVIFYILLVILTLFVLRLLNVPVTIFTVIGGALAIGVGFGSQNIVNNFISGLVLMIERPVRVGDFIQVNSLTGRVENIGARSTVIKSMENKQIVVPNSDFLEKQVVNWTLSDDLIRTKLTIGVAYGSDTELVKELLLKATKSEDKVLRYPEPVVIFEDFADSSLNFEIYYWAKLRDMIQLKILASNIRFTIDRSFREANVVIAFPQRDVHLGTERPLQIELTKMP